MNSAAEIADRLADHAEALAAELLPGGRRDGHRWVCGSVAGERGESLSLVLHGERRGRWRDFATDEGGDMLDLIGAALFHCDLKAALTWARHWLGLGDTEAPQPTRRPPPTPIAEPTAAEKLERARRLLARSAPIWGSPAEAYLKGRGLTLPRRGCLLDQEVLRFVVDAYHWPSGQRLPAMLAPITGILTNEVQALHLTFLRPDGGGKAEVEKARLYLGPKSGGVVRLSPDADVSTGLAIAEGIETALTGLAAGYPGWACLDAGNVGEFPVLSGIEAMTVLADHDPAGLAAAEKVARRWRNAGREVRVLMPPQAGADWNDRLQEAGHG